MLCYNTHPRPKSKDAGELSQSATDFYRSIEQHGTNKRNSHDLQQLGTNLAMRDQKLGRIF